MLRREYHAKDADTAEKDLHTQRRINSLKEWKARAIHQMKLMHEKLRTSVPVSEFDLMSKEVELAKTRSNDYIIRNSKLVNQNTQLQKKLRENLDAETQMR